MGGQEYSVRWHDIRFFDYIYTVSFVDVLFIVYISVRGRICEQSEQEIIMHDLTGKDVQVITADMTYRGILVEIGEQDIHLQTENGWIVVPLEKVMDIRLSS